MNMTDPIQITPHLFLVSYYFVKIEIWNENEHMTSEIRKAIYGQEPIKSGRKLGM